MDPPEPEAASEAGEAANEAPVLRPRSIAQLSVLKALRAHDRFTIGKVAARAGVPAATLRSLLLRWHRLGFPLLTEIGADRGPAVGQPPKLYVLTPNMLPVVDGAIAAADAEWTAAAEKPWVAAPTQAAPIDRLNFLDAATDLLAEAEQTDEPARRAELLVEADRLLSDCRIHLQERTAMGLPEASAGLRDGLEQLERRVAFLRPSHDRLFWEINERAEEVRRRAKAYAHAHEADLAEGEVAPPKLTAEDSFAWLTASAKHYLQTAPSGRDTEVGFFAGLLLVRGELGAAQDSLVDEWLKAIERDERAEARREAEIRAAGGAATLIKAEVSWTRLCEKFAIALDRMVACGWDARGWTPLITGILKGIRN